MINLLYFQVLVIVFAGGKKLYRGGRDLWVGPVRCILFQIHFFIEVCGNYDTIKVGVVKTVPANHRNDRQRLRTGAAQSECTLCLKRHCMRFGAHAGNIKRFARKKGREQRS